jgi:hypothetical protein
LRIEDMGFTILAIGVLLFAGMIGLLAGVSASPVVAALLPLLFALLTAGGGIWLIRSDAKVLLLSKRHALALGLQLLAFIIGFLPGLWAGIYVRFYPDTVGLPSRAPAYDKLEFTDPLLLAWMISLDERMKASNLPFPRRQQILGRLFESINKEGLSSEEIESLTAILNPSEADDEPVLPPPPP